LPRIIGCFAFTAPGQVFQLRLATGGIFVLLPGATQSS
jgi:hypothetical protein